MIEYKILTKPEEKILIKKEFLDFFATVYKKELNENSWYHHIINSPYNNTPLFIAMQENTIIGSALMILQKCIIEEKKYNYFLFTTSAICKEFRPKGIYAELLKIQKEYAKQNNADFIFAFPNKLAYPILKLFGGFKDLKKFNLVKTNFDNINLENINNSLIIDTNIFNWRFEHKNYKFHIINDSVLVFKDFQDSYDILGIYKSVDFNFNFIDSLLEKKKNIITLNCYVKKEYNTQVIDTIYTTYFPINKSIDYSKYNINLLMSDVF
ncbi:GNAT family N-acetyltransferase [Arcobacter sp. KX21116]|uniref:hypothetical protein n=1 Tax=Arcobacter iocasae TaxID=2906515 RepID=UPI0035D4FF9C